MTTDINFFCRKNNQNGVGVELGMRWLFRDTENHIIDKRLYELKVWKLYKIIICMCSIVYYIHASATIFCIYKSFYAVRVN